MFSREYKEKFRTPEEAVKVVKSGDWIDYMYFNGYPKALDKALAKRKDELYGVHITLADTPAHCSPLSYFFGNIVANSMPELETIIVS
jgi:acyl-CoA hydrolase